MPKALADRIADALNVSPAFDNCFFHSYAIHLLANNLPLPEDLFTFKSIIGEESPASKLQARFPSEKDLSLFEEYANLLHPKPVPLSPNFIVEKTLILGFLMREWFATQLAQNENLQQKAVTHFQDFRRTVYEEVNQKVLYDGLSGCLYTANQKFLEFFIAYDPNGTPKSEEDFRFASYFVQAGGDEARALADYWQAEGRKNYLDLIASPYRKIAYEELVPVLEMRGQSLSVYDAKNSSVAYSHEAGERLPKMELKLDAGQGHFYLLKTDKTESALNEYQQSYEQYKQDRDAILRIEAPTKTKELAAANKFSLLVEAICPDGTFTKSAFDSLIGKVDHLRGFVQSHQQGKVEQRQKPHHEEPPAKQQEEPNIQNIVKQFVSKMEELSSQWEPMVKRQIHRSTQTINEYLERIRLFPVSFDESMDAKSIETRKKALLEQLNAMANETQLEQSIEALLNLFVLVQAPPEITQAIAQKTQEINATAKQKLQECQLQQPVERTISRDDSATRIQSLSVSFDGSMNTESIETRRGELVKQLNALTSNNEEQTPEVQKTPEIYLAEQEQLKKLNQVQHAKHIINTYISQIRSLSVSFDGLMDTQSITARKIKLLGKLQAITVNNQDLREALETLGTRQHSEMTQAIIGKKKEIDVAEQEQHTKRAERERQVLHHAEHIFNYYIKQIQSLPVSFDGLMSTESIKEHQQKLLGELQALILNKQDLSQALKTLNKELSPEIAQAIAAKAQEINLAEQQQYKKRQEEEQQRQIQHAQEIINQYIEEIQSLPVSFEGLRNAESINARHEELLGALKAITLNKEDLNQALNALNKEHSPEIAQAIAEKTQEIKQQNLVAVELEEQLLNQRRQQAIVQELSRIDGALASLQRRINHRDQHYSSEAFNEATLLFRRLENARQEYGTALDQPGVVPSQASTVFKNICATLINEAKPLLENDLSLWEYVCNVLRTIGNALDRLINPGRRDSFFPIVRTESILALEEAEQTLELGR